MNDYFSNLKPKKDMYLKIADYSCGGGAFLVAASKICQERNIPVEIYGYDVDPIAVMITKFRFTKKNYANVKNINISLGNPLIRLETGTDALDKFKMAALGRFYSLEMGIIPEKNVPVIVGNPPWEKIRFEEKKFLSHYASNENIDHKAERERYVEKISEENRLFYHVFYSDYEKAKKHMKKDAYFAKSCCGELNTYALFTELCRTSLCDEGVAGLIVKSSLVKMPVYRKFFRDMTKSKDLFEIYMFVNRKKIFHIDSREEFSVLYLKKGNKNNLKLALNLHSYEDFGSSPKIELPYDLLNQLNPDTGMIPISIFCCDRLLKNFQNE